METHLARVARPVTPAGLAPPRLPGGRSAASRRALFRSGGHWQHPHILGAAQIGAMLSLAMALAACGSAHSGSPAGEASGGSGPPRSSDGRGPPRSSGGSGPPRSSGGAVGSTPTLSNPASTELPPAMQPNRLNPDARAVDLRAVRWQRAEDLGRSLTVFFTTTGRRECATLGRVEVVESATTVTVTVFVGRLPAADCNGSQPQLAAPATAVVTLARDLGGRTIIDGSLPHT